jgi:BMFP domain-containing protein YqiC
MKLPDPEGEKIDNLEKRVTELEARLSIRKERKNEDF